MLNARGCLVIVACAKFATSYGTPKITKQIEASENLLFYDGRVISNSLLLFLNEQGEHNYLHFCKTWYLQKE